MVVVLKKSTTEEQIANLVSWLKAQGLEADISSGRNTTIVGLVGDVSRVDTELLEALEIVESVKRVSEPFKAANRKFHPVDTVVELSDGTKIGGGNFAVFAGPSAVESEEQILQVAEAARRNGARILMGGAFKSRTSPYSFQGLGKEGLDLLLKAKRATGLPVMSELVDAADLDLYEDVDILQIGSRNMQNFSLLRELGHSSKPVLLKRGLANTVEEWLMSAEYILAEGNRNVILCERGIRSISESTRNSMDLSVVPVVHKLSHLPVVSDPCHAIGNAEFVPAMACAATAAGTDGLLLEIHPDPTKALCDGVQSIAVEQLGPLCEKIRKIREALK